MDLNLIYQFFDDEDFFDILLLQLVDEGNQAKKENFDFSKIDPIESKLLFRFEKEDLLRLKAALNIPDYLTGGTGIKFSGIEGLCIFLRRLSYPNRLFDLSKIFPRSVQDISVICWTMLEFLYNNHHQLISNLDQWWLKNPYLENYAEAITNRGAPLRNCIGFIDGTLRPTCKPGRDQREMFSGHKRTHGQKFQALVISNGLIADLYGPMNARRHDSYMLAASGLTGRMEILPAPADDGVYCIYGDPAYPISAQLIAPFRNANNPNEIEFNGRMSKVRVAVEWEFGWMIRLFAFLDFKKNLKIFLQPVAKLYIVAAILKNCHNCLYGSETSVYFNVQPPNLEYYINGNQN